MAILDDPASRRFARLAGALYFLIGVTGVFGILWVPSQLTVPGDPQGTLQLIAQRPDLMSAGVGSDIILMLAEILLAVMFYVMFRSYGPVLAMTAMAARLIMVAVMATMLLPEAGIQTLTALETEFFGLDPIQRAEIAWVLRDIHDAGVMVWQVFFTLHLWLLGVLVWRSGCVPRLLAVGLTIGGTGYLFASMHTFHFANLIALEHAMIGLLAIATLAEIGFAIWLLVCGCVLPKQAERAG